MKASLVPLAGGQEKMSRKAPGRWPKNMLLKGQKTCC